MSSFYTNILPTELYSELVAFIQTLEFKPLIAGGTPNRRVCFGYNYSIRKRGVAEKTEIPAILHKVAKYLPSEWVGEIEQCIINRYEGKQGIGRHVDASAFGDVIAGITIGGGAMIVFRDEQRKIVKQVYASDNTCYILTGDFRHKFTHEIPVRLSDTVERKKVPRTVRYSITFRTLASD